MSVELRWLGHGSWSLDIDGHAVVLDPFFNDSPTSPVKADEVAAETILISHGHFDHIADACSIAKRTGAVCVCNFEIHSWLSDQGVERTTPMNSGGTVELPFGKVTLTAAVHSSSFPDGSYAGLAGGFVLQLAAGNIYFACDTALFGDMEWIGAMGIDLAVLPIGDVYTMGPDASLRAIQLIAPKRVAPAHYNTWPPIEQDAQAWADQVRRQTNAEPIVLNPGDRFAL
ncbi:MAG: metal-dependent hydrolase [Pirellulales bacterium]